MRLTQFQIATLKQVAGEVFGSEIQLYLFGSRVDDQRAGGDIDLYVVGFNRSIEQQVDAKLVSWPKLKWFSVNSASTLFLHRKKGSRICQFISRRN